MPGESLSFNITADDRASSKFREVGRSALDSSAKMDVAAASLKLWNDTAVKQGKAADTSLKAMQAHAKATALIGDAENVLAGKATKTTKLMADQGKALEGIAKKAEDASGGFDLISNSAGLTTSGLGALIGVGVALSPIIATLGVGLGGLALAALAAGKNSKAFADAAAPLKAEFAGFSKELQPVLLSDFAKAAGVAGNVLHDIEPVAAATGKALGGMLTAVDAEFQSGAWQQFFQFMARTAGPDIKLLTDNFVGLLNVLPPLLESLQPVAATLLKDTSGLLNLVSATEKVIEAQHRFTQEASNNTGWLGRLAHAAGDAFKQLVPGGVGIKHIADELGKLSSNTGDAAHKQAVIATTFGHSGDVAEIAASKVQSLADAVAALNTQLNNSIKPNATFNQDLINVKQSAHDAAQALKKSHDSIDANTQAGRTSATAMQHQIDVLTQLTQDAGKNRQKQDEATDAIHRALPQLENVKGGTREYWQEVRTLIAWLERERRERNIHKVVSISGAATWSLSNPGGKLAGPTGSAAGWLVSGGTPGRDSVPIMAMPGELVVPTKMVKSGAVDHLRGSIPGFAAGGIIPSYGGSVAGLVPWGQHNVNASNAWLINAMASALTRAITAVGLPSGHGSIGGGVQRWAGAALQVLRMLGQPAGDLGTVLSQMTTESGGNPFVVNKWDSNWARGTPSVGLMQVIGPTFGAYAGPFRGTGPFEYGVSVNPLANIFAGINYAIHRYGAAWTSVLGHGHGYDSGGFLPTGLSLAYNGTGRPEQVIPHGRAGGNSYSITVNAGPTAHKAEIGRVVVEAIREYERRSGKGWRS